MKACWLTESGRGGTGSISCPDGFYADLLGVVHGHLKDRKSCLEWLSCKSARVRATQPNVQRHLSGLHKMQKARDEI